MNFSQVKAVRMQTAVGSRDVKAIRDFTGRPLWEKPLPYDAVVGWLQASGGPYIVTGLSTPDLRRVAIKMEIVSRPPTGTDLIFGQSGYYGSSAQRGRILMACITPGGSLSYYDRPDYGRITFPDGAFPYIVENDTSFAAPQTITNSQRILVFRAAQDNASGYPSPANGGVYRLYYLRMWGPDGLLRDFIPVRVGTVGYLYDSVTGTLFGNAGDGAFVVGPDAP